MEVEVLQQAKRQAERIHNRADALASALTSFNNSSSMAKRHHPFVITKEPKYQSQAPKSQHNTHTTTTQPRSAAQLLNQEPGVNLMQQPSRHHLQIYKISPLTAPFREQLLKTPATYARLPEMKDSNDLRVMPKERRLLMIMNSGMGSTCV